MRFMRAIHSYVHRPGPRTPRDLVPRVLGLPVRSQLTSPLPPVLAKESPSSPQPEPTAYLHQLALSLSGEELALGVVEIPYWA